MGATQMDMPHAAVQAVRAKDLTPESQALARGVAFARIATGAWFLGHEFYYEKVHSWTSKTLPGQLASWTGKVRSPTSAPPYGWYKAILNHVAVPHAQFFRYLITSWELVLGLCLVVGLAVRIVTPVQIFLNLNYMIAKTYLSGGANLDRVTIIVLLGLFLAGAGRYWGVDGVLRRRYARLRWL
jgi:uncharacterized membrane protein YphA (DoxX/SURF4 family)